MICIGLLFAGLLSAAQVINFDKTGRQLVKFDKLGNAVDAHDGEIAVFDGVYYLYGTSYDCGYEWGNKEAPFCGFKVYASTDMKNWEDRGFLFDAKSAVWQSRCDGKTYGCYRPHVVFNKKTGLYVLWINVYDNVVGYRVFTSPTPAGPFTEVAEPKLAVNSDMPAAGLNNGDHDTFVDDDGRAYLAYTDWRAKGAIIIEELTDDYLSGTGKHVKSVTADKTEAPCLFKRDKKYYVVYSDPNCGYCSGTGSSYKTADSPLGPWSDAISISDNSCGGQPSFVSVLKLDSETVFLYGSDLWNNAAKNEALANFYWAPLEFDAAGAIKPLLCSDQYRVPKSGAKEIPARASGDAAKGSNVPAPGKGAKGSKSVMVVREGASGYSINDGIRADTGFAQSFTLKQGGSMSGLSVTLFRNKYPDAGLLLEIFAAGSDGQPSGGALFSTTLQADAMGWSPKMMEFHPGIKVKKGGRYILVLSTKARKGNYGFVMDDAPSPAGQQLFTVHGQARRLVLLPRGSIKFETTVTP